MSKPVSNAAIPNPNNASQGQIQQSLKGAERQNNDFSHDHVVWIRNSDGIKEI